MQSIELKLTFSELSELAAFVAGMPNLQLAAPKAAPDLRVVAGTATAALPAPAAAPAQHHHHANGAAAPAPAQLQPAPTPAPAPQPAAPAADAATINRVMRERMQGAGEYAGQPRLTPDVLRGLFNRYGAQGVAALKPDQYENFLFELQTL